MVAGAGVTVGAGAGEASGSFEALVSHFFFLAAKTLKML